MKMLIITTLIAFLSIGISSYGPKKPYLAEKDEIIAQAKKELDATMADPESKLRKYILKNQIKGEFIFDITIAEKGAVLTVFSVSSDADDIKKQNLMKDGVKALVFNFKMPKDKSYKFQYTFNI